MKKIILSFSLVAILAAHSSQSATTLATGDVQIFGYREDDPDTLMFVLWKNIDATTVLSFTDNTYSSTTGWGTTEGVLNWMSGTSFSAGTVIRLTGPATGNLSVASQGIVLNATGNPNLSASGDSITVFQGTFNDASQVNLYAMDFESSTSANLGNTPSGLTVGSTAFLSSTASDNGYYSGTRSFTAGANAAANIASAKTSILNSANWTKSSTGTEAGFLIPTGAGFSTSSFLLSSYYQWNAGTGAWNTTSSNWLLNGSGSPTSFVSGGDASINGGTLAVQAEGISAGTVNISGATATVINGGSLTATTINKSGSGTLEFANANNVGTFIVDDTSVSGAGSVNASSGIAVGVSTNSQTISVGLSGAGSLTKAGAGELILSGAKTYTGNTVVGGGTLTTGGADVLSDSTAVTIYGGATLKLGGNETVASVASTSTAATLSLQGNSLTVGATGLSFTNQALTTGTGGIVKNGTGLIYLNNANNTYSGGFTLNNGEVQFTASGNVVGGALTTSVFGTGTVTLNGGTIGSSSTSGSSGRNIFNNIVLNGNVQSGMTSWGTTNAVMNGGTSLLNISTNAAGRTTLLSDSTINTLGYTIWEQNISGDYRITKTGTGASSLSNNYLRLSGSNNIAGVTVNSGILSYKNRNALGTGTLILANGVVVGQDGPINNTATSDVIADRTIANNISLLGNVTFGLGNTASYFGGGIDLNSETRTLTMQNDSYFFGSIANGGLVAQRTDTDLTSSKMFALYGANTYDGGTTVIGVADRTNNLTLGLGNNSALGTGSLTFSGGGTNLVRALTLSTTDLNRTITNNIAINSGVSVSVETMSSLTTVVAGSAVTNNVSVNVALNGVISGGGALIKTNSNTLSLGGANTYAGGTIVNGGSLAVLNTTGSGTGSGDVTVNAGSTVTGSGKISGTVRGAGLVTAGTASTATSTAMLQVGQLDTSTAMRFAFEATSTSLLTASAYNNDVISATATAGSPFTQALASSNIIDIYLNAGSLAGYDNGNAGVFQTGFFSGSDFSLGSGTFNLFVQAASGTTTYNAATYQTWAEYMTSTGTALNQSYTIGTTSATLASGDTGFISTVTIVPEPSTGAMLVFGLVGLVGVRALRRKA